MYGAKPSRQFQVNADGMWCCLILCLHVSRSNTLLLSSVHGVYISPFITVSSLLSLLGPTCLTDGMSPHRVSSANALLLYLIYSIHAVFSQSKHRCLCRNSSHNHPQLHLPKLRHWQRPTRVLQRHNQGVLGHLYQTTKRQH